jgi:hypothetical protein
VIWDADASGIRERTLGGKFKHIEHRHVPATASALSDVGANQPPAFNKKNDGALDGAAGQVASTIRRTTAHGRDNMPDRGKGIAILGVHVPTDKEAIDGARRIR